MSKHTKGPWRVRRAHEGYEIESESGPVTTDAGMSAADAALMCAAPELLSACEAAFTNLDRSVRGARPAMNDLTLANMLRAAIEKARGGR